MALQGSPSIFAPCSTTLIEQTFTETTLAQSRQANSSSSSIWTYVPATWEEPPSRLGHSWSRCGPPQLVELGFPLMFPPIEGFEGVMWPLTLLLLMVPKLHFLAWRKGLGMSTFPARSSFLLGGLPNAYVLCYVDCLLQAAGASFSTFFLIEGRNPQRNLCNMSKLFMLVILQHISFLLGNIFLDLSKFLF